MEIYSFPPHRLNHACFTDILEVLQEELTVLLSKAFFFVTSDYAGFLCHPS